MKGRLLRAFAAAILLPALAGQGAYAQAEDTGVDTPDGEDSSLTETSRFLATGQVALPDLIQDMCREADMVLLGDTDHTDLSLRRAVSNAGFAAGLKSCGITHVFIEMGADGQGVLDAFQGTSDGSGDGHGDLARLQRELPERMSNIYEMSEDDWAETVKLRAEFISHLADNGIRVHAADPGTDGDVPALMSIMMYQGAMNLLRRELADIKPEYGGYFDGYMAGDDGAIPEAEKPAFEEAFERVNKEHEIGKTFEKADALREQGVSARTDDTALAAHIRANLPQGAKALLIYGAQDMSGPRPEGIDSLLAQHMKVKRLDIVSSRDDVDYARGDDLPDAVFVTADSSVMQPAGAEMRLGSRLAIAPGGGKK